MHKIVFYVFQPTVFLHFIVIKIKVYTVFFIPEMIPKNPDHQLDTTKTLESYGYNNLTQLRVSLYKKDLK